MIRILINFMQRINKFHTFVFNNKYFFVDIITIILSLIFLIYLESLIKDDE